MSDSVKNHLVESYALAKQAYACGNYPIGWVLIVDGTIRIEWQNQVNTKQEVQLHAEIDIIRKSEEYRWGGHHKILFVSMEPCNMCANSLVQFWVNEVYYILEDPVWGWRVILEAHGVRVFQVREKYNEYVALMRVFLKKSGKYPELLESYNSEIQTSHISNISPDVPSTKREIDLNQILTIQEGLTSLISQIDARKQIPSEQEKKQALHWLIEARLFRYAVRIRDEYGLKGEEEIKIQFYLIVRDIFDFALGLVQKEWAITREELSVLHTKLFPKWLWGQSKWPEGVPMKVLFPAGEYRNKREFRMYDGVEYDYIEPEAIEESLASLDRFMQEENGIHFLIKSIVFYHTAWSIHPYYNGNGTLSLLLVGILLLRNDYLIPQGFSAHIQSMIEHEHFLEADRGDIEPMIREFLEVFAGK